MFIASSFLMEVGTVSFTLHFKLNLGKTLARTTRHDLVIAFRDTL